MSVAEVEGPFLKAFELVPAEVTFEPAAVEVSDVSVLQAIPSKAALVNGAIAECQTAVAISHILPPVPDIVASVGKELKAEAFSGRPLVEVALEKVCVQITFAAQGEMIHVIVVNIIRKWNYKDC